MRLFRELDAPAAHALDVAVLNQPKDQLINRLPSASRFNSQLCQCPWATSSAHDFDDPRLLRPREALQRDLIRGSA